MRRRRKSLILGIFLLLCGLGIGYAFLNTTLNINGVAEVDSNNWDVYWDNVQVTSGSVEATTPTIDTNKTSVSFQVHLSKPGDFYEFTVDAKNDGSIDAMIESITQTINSEAPIDYTVTYEDGLTIRENQLLKANEKEIYKVRVAFRTDINKDDLPSNPESITLSFGVTYVQAESGAEDVRKIIYSTGLGAGLYEDIDLEEETYYDTPEEAIEELITNYQMDKFYLKAIVGDGKVIDGYVVFTVTPELAALHPGMTAGTYALRAGGATKNLAISNYYQYDSIYYEENKQILSTAFGSSNCYENISDSFGNYSCGVSEMDVLLIKNGSIWVTDDTLSGVMSCVINEWGSAAGRIFFQCGNFD